ncbi:MAG: hypothetical protein P8Y67_12540 [Alphaproteobacteria bacterium]
MSGTDPKLDIEGGEEIKGGVFALFKRGRERYDKSLFKRLYEWYDKFDTWKERIEWIMAFLKGHAVVTTVAATASAVAVTGAVVATNPALIEGWFPATKAEQPAPKPKKKVKVEPKRWGSSVIFSIEGKDTTGRRAAFDIAVLPKNLAWVNKSATRLKEGAEVIPEDNTVSRIFTSELRAGLGRSSEVMAVGLASQEGRLDEETERAANRARTAAGWLAETIAPETVIWTLNLGQFQAGCKATTEATDTSWQRPVVIVGIREAAEGVTLTEAFADAISGKTNLPSRDCYSSFELTRFR